MKRLLSLVSICLFTTTTWADMNAMNVKTDELELEQEVESIEQFGSDATAVETQRESDKLSRETKSLEKDISKLKSANIRAQDKTKRLAALYQKKASLAAEVQKQAALAEKQKNKSEKQVATLDSKVKAKEQKVIQSVEKRKTAEIRLRELTQSTRQLQKRMTVAEATIKRNENRRKILRAQNLRMAQKKAQLNRKVVRAESRARSRAM